MPLYEYRCRTCDELFELRRSMSEAGDTASCPQGHADTVRLLSAFATIGASVSSGSAPASPAGGGCCGGSCGCR